MGLLDHERPSERGNLQVQMQGRHLPSRRAPGPGKLVVELQRQRLGPPAGGGGGRGIQAVGASSSVPGPVRRPLGRWLPT